MYIAISIVLALVVGGIFMAILGCDRLKGTDHILKGVFFLWTGA
jgi:ABC-type uncharacterized transport system permease subunit